MDATPAIMLVSHPMVRSLVRSLVAVLCLLSATRALALHQESPAVIALTSGAPHTPPGRSWDNWIAFSSTEDLAGLGGSRAPGRQLFVFNLDYYDCAHGTTFPATPCPPPGTAALAQVTNGPGNPDDPSIATIPTPPSAADHWLAFDADGGFGGLLTGTATGRRQVFLLNLRTNELRAVTSASDGDSVRPSVSKLAGLVVFESTAALAGFPNPAGVSQVYAYERASNVLRRLSIGPPPANILALGPSTDVVTNQNGTLVAFASRADLLGSGTDTGVWQVFLAAYDSQSHTSQLTRITAGNGPSRHPFLGDGPSGESNALVFDSTATNLPGSAGLPGDQIYAVSLPTTPLPSVQHLTLSTLFGDCSAPTIDSSGDRVAFACTGDPLQNGTAGARLFVLDRPSGTLYQLTGRGTVTPPVAASLGQWFATVVTTSDLTGRGACVSQLYVLDYFAGKWAAATMLGQAPPDVFQPNACAPACSTSPECDDHNPCNGVETCVGGLCRPGTPVVCSDGNVCNGVETCNQATGGCTPGTPLSCNDGNPCNGVETCAPAVGCVPGTPIVCSDGNACNGLETCNPSSGTCQPGTPPVCNDANPCTDDSCVPASGCTFTPNANPCDDGDPCTTGDACSGALCTGAPLGCGPCESCSAGSCVIAPAASCAGGGSHFAAQLVMKERPRGDLMLWKWQRGPAIVSKDLGDPTLSDDYAFCIYDAGGGLLLRASAPAGGLCGTKPCWKPLGLSGWRYSDQFGTPDGLQKLLLRAGDAGKSRLALKGKGAHLAVPALGSLALPLRTQLRNQAGGCWEADFPQSSVLKSDTGVFKAKQ